MPAPVLPWLDYRWALDFPVAMFAAVCARLRGTPARLEESLHGAEPALLTCRSEGKWSAQGHAGHLVKVEALWQKRLAEYRRGAAVLTAADMSNRATEEADSDALPLDDVLGAFRAVRSATMERLDALSLDDAARVAHHPRLDRPMRLIDLCFFAAEHDDHHLAAIHSLFDR
jgi:uncharacterized damage-inducible protein DinB